MPPNKKKKKPGGNPTRGVATTSIPRRAKPDLQDSTDTLETASTATAPTSTASDDATRSESYNSAKHVRCLNGLGPEELERQLEESELQLLVEKLAPKARKESARQLARARTDQRMLRPQAERLRTRSWLPDELMLEILDLVKQDAHNDDHSSEALRGRDLSEEDFIAKVWALEVTLAGLELSREQIDVAIRYITANPPATEGALLWGFEECLEYLALQDQGLGEYDKRITMPARTTTVDSQGDPQLCSAVQGFAVESEEQQISQSINDHVAGADGTSSYGKVDPESNGNPSAGNDAGISDFESDLEPEETQGKYLSTKARLYEINPVLVEPRPQSRKQKPKSRADDPTLLNITPEIRRLQQILQRIEADVLFDKQDTEVKWIAKRNELAQEKASRKRLGLIAEPGVSGSHEGSGVEGDAVKDAEVDGHVPLDQDDDETFGALFDSASDEQGTQNVNLPSVNGETVVTIRDFGKFTGMNPRRVLEEACRARDHGVTFAYKPVSNVSFASRYSLTITWSKDQEPLVSHVPDVVTKITRRSHVFTMMTTATPDATQSEAYISTVALFLLFAASPREEKCYLRLPLVWRDVWSEFAEIKKEDDETADMETVREIRALVRAHMERAEENGEVLTSEFQKRLKVNENVGVDRRNRITAGDAIPTEPLELQVLWSRKTASPAYQRMLTSRTNLPMFQFKDATLAAIDENQVIIICGETGCGKSTQVPSFILEQEHSSSRPCKIYVTEPRRISAISLAHRVSEELGEHKSDLGTPRSLVGYVIKLESHVTPQTRLVFATVGIVLRMLESSGSGDFKGITHLIIDEVHERSIDTDFLLIVLKALMTHRPDLKVVLMSATVDAQRFSTYLHGAPILSVPGRTFPVRTNFLEDAIELTHFHPDRDEYGDNGKHEADTEDDPEVLRKSGVANLLEGYSPSTRNTLAHYDEYKIDYSLIIKLIDKIARDKQYSVYSKAILVFLPGIAEIRKLNDLLAGHAFFSHHWLILPLHSTIASEDQQAAFRIPPRGYRKIVLATNIAETGITIPDVTCVIDTGKHKEMRFDERRQLSRLTQSFISRANAKQRRGRAGRVQEGVCFHLFTRMRHDELMSEQQTPEMLRLSLQDLVMRVKICNLGDIEQTLQKALDPPSSKNIRRAIGALIGVGALSPNEELTPLGEQLAKLPLDAYLGKLIIIGNAFGCLDVSLTVAAMLSSKPPFVTPMGNRQSADAARLAYKRGDSDLLTAYNAYCAWRRVCTTPGSSEDQFCRKNFLSSQNLANIEELKGQLLTTLSDAGFVKLGEEERAALSRVRYTSRQTHFVLVPPSSNINNDNDILVTSVIALSFYPKLLIRDGNGWRNCSNNQSVSLAPTSVNKTNPTANYLSYYHIMQSNSRFTNAHETSPVPIPALVLLIGSAAFNIYAGVMIIDGNRFRFSVDEWRTLVAIKALRSGMAEVVARMVKNPLKGLTGRAKRWMEIWGEVVRCAGEAAEREAKRIR